MYVCMYICAYIILADRMSRFCQAMYNMDVHEGESNRIIHNIRIDQLHDSSAVHDSDPTDDDDG
jgi:hypothetical protein